MFYLSRIYTRQLCGVIFEVLQANSSKNRHNSMTSPILKHLCTGYRFWPDSCLDFAWNFEDFESADKIGVSKSGFSFFSTISWFWEIYPKDLLHAYRPISPKTTSKWDSSLSWEQTIKHGSSNIWALCVGWFARTLQTLFLAMWHLLL